MLLHLLSGHKQTTTHHHQYSREMNKGEQIRADPKIQRAVKEGVPWAVKLNSKGWASLSTNQKRRAEELVQFKPTLVMVPKTVRLTKPPNKGSWDGPRQACKSSTETKEELLCTVMSSMGAEPVFRSWVVSPRNMAIFPQLSLMALNFNKYKVVNMSIVYSPACSFETNGRVALGFNDDATDPEPRNKVRFYELDKHVATAAQSPVVLNIPRDNKVRFMRDSTSDDGKLVDFGRITMLTYGFDEAGVAVGELFIRYTIVLSDPTKTSRVTQCYTIGKSVGPEYGIITSSETKFNIKFSAGGSWLVTLLGSNAGDFSAPVITGPGSTSKTTYESSTPIAVCEVEAQTEDTNLSTVTTEAGTGVTACYISRL